MSVKKADKNKSCKCKNPDHYQAPYAFNGPYWIAYDDVKAFEVKARLVNFMELAGAMVFSIDTDDFRGDYGKRYPMLNVSSYFKNV